MPTDLDVINRSLQAAAWLTAATRHSKTTGRFISGRASPSSPLSPPTRGGGTHSTSTAKPMGSKLNANPRGMPDGGNIPRSAAKSAVVTPKTDAGQSASYKAMSEDKYKAISTAHADKVATTLGRQSDRKWAREGNSFTTSEGSVSAKIAVGSFERSSGLSPRTIMLTVKDGKDTVTSQSYGASVHAASAASRELKERAAANAEKERWAPKRKRRS